MALITSSAASASGTASANVGPVAASALHVAPRPLAHGTGGHYQLAVTTGTIAANLATGAQVLTLRWTSATKYFVLFRLTARFQALTLFTAATLADFGFDLFKATSVSAGGGGNGVTGSTINKARTSMPNSIMATNDIRYASTAALTALTTLGATAISSSLGDQQRVNPAAATEEQRVNDPTLIYAPDIASGEHPIVLEANEGLVVLNRNTWPAAGTGVMQFELAWAEVDAY